jgi:hypothetical protein
MQNIVYQINKTVGLSVRRRADNGKNSPISINLADGVRARGNVDIHNISITVDAGTYVGSQTEGEKIAVLCSSLKELLPTQKLALLFVESHEFEKADLNRLRRVLWDEALAELTADGLLLIDLSNSSKSPVDALVWPPDPDLSLDLPDKYEDQSYAAAHEDLIEVALSEGIYPSHAEAVVFADMLLADSENIKILYSKIASIVIRLPRRANEP